jgi:hypothetical protein
MRCERGRQGLMRCCPWWYGSAGRSRRQEWGPVVTGDAGVVEDGLCIGVELM